MVGRVFDTFKHSNVKAKAEYRRIGKNYKSLAKFKAERLRVGRFWIVNTKFGQVDLQTN